MPAGRDRIPGQHGTDSRQATPKFESVKYSSTVRFPKWARGNGGEPDAGRFLHSWARQVGFDAHKVECSTGTWCYHSESERKWWGGLWADRTLQSNFATTATKNGWATQEELETVAQTWRDWAADEDGWISLVHGEIIAHV